MSHAAAYGRLAGGTAEKVHNSDVRVPRQACCILDPKRTRWCVIREGKSKVFYETYGSGSKHIVLVMGLAAVHMQWEPQIQYFGLDRSDQYTVAVFDGRGIGFSEDCGGRWRTTDLAQDVIAIVNQLGWSEGCHLVGFSLGGMISLEALLARPDIFDSLALISSHAGGLLAVVPPLRGWLPFMKTFACLGSGGALDAGLELLFPPEWLDTSTDREPADPGAPATVRYERARALILRARKYVESGHFPEIRLPGVIRQIGAVITHYVSPERLCHIRDCRVPVLCVAGLKDNLVSPRNSAYMVSKTSGSLLEFEDAGHGCHEQYEGPVNAALERHFTEASGSDKSSRKTLLPTWNLLGVSLRSLTITAVCVLFIVLRHWRFRFRPR